MDNKVIEIFGMKMEIIENAAHGHNWCTMCALEPFCEKTGIESQLYPCTNTKGATNRYFKRIYEDKDIVKETKFDPHTLQPFDKVLARWSKGTHPWEPLFFSHFCKPGWAEFIGNAAEGFICDMIIPYNDETKYLLGTFQDPPEYYKYWDDKINDENKK